jgi:protein SCO1/2
VTVSPPDSRRPRLTRGLALAIAAGGLVLLAILWAAMWPTSAPRSLIGGPFALETGDGKTITDASLRGEPFLVYFGYTHCPDVCPTELAAISDVLRAMPDKRVKALFITVDPERDTPAVMADYVSSFDNRIIGLSGSPQAIAQVEKDYRVYSRKADPQPNGDYSMDHSSVIYLMDSKGAFAEVFRVDRPPEQSAKELEGYL